MAFIRKRGSWFYLVHNVRKKGRVRQIHLARLGRLPRISDDLIRGVEAHHPFVRVNWKDLRERASHELVQPMQNVAYVRGLLSEIRNVHLEIADLHLPVLELVHGEDLSAQVRSELKLLRGTLDVKLGPFRKGKPLSLRN